MPSKRVWRTRAPLLLLVVAGACIRPPPAPAPPAPVAAAAETRTGVFHTVWGEAPRYFVTDDEGRTTELVFGDEVVRAHGGARALDRRRVVVTGAARAAGLFGATSITPTERPR